MLPVKLNTVISGHSIPSWSWKSMAEIGVGYSLKIFTVKKAFYYT